MYLVSRYIPGVAPCITRVTLSEEFTIVSTPGSVQKTPRDASTEMYRRGFRNTTNVVCVRLSNFGGGFSETHPRIPGIRIMYTHVIISKILKWM